MVRAENVVVTIVNNADWGDVQIVNLAMNLDINLTHTLRHIIAKL
jgi:hypothetical protein